MAADNCDISCAKGPVIESDHRPHKANRSEERLLTSAGRRIRRSECGRKSQPAPFEMTGPGATACWSGAMYGAINRTEPATNYLTRGGRQSGQEFIPNV